jgi:hypothetical protein
MRFAIEGLIENVGAADIFLFLSQTQRTSVTAFERPDQETRVFFVNGQPVWAVSSKVQLQLEARLAAGGGLKLRDIEAALTRQNAGANRIPQALIAERCATEESMEKDLRGLSLDALRDVATWTSGTFTIYDGVVPPPWAHTIAPDFAAILIEALRSQCQKETLQKEFPARKGILRARTALRNPAPLNDSERNVLALVNGERTVEDIVKRSGLDELQALGAMHVLCALHFADLLPPLRIARPDKAATSAPPPSPPPPRPPAGQRDDVTNELLPLPSEPKAASRSLADLPTKVPGPPVRTSDSTAKLQALAQAAAPKAPTRSLHILNEGKTEVVELVVPTFAIGRHPRNDLVLKDPRISSFHCRVEVEGNKCVLLDLKSRNGTLLNSARIDRAVLKHNDQIQLGSTKVSYIETR